MVKHVYKATHALAQTRTDGKSETARVEIGRNTREGVENLIETLSVGGSFGRGSFFHKWWGGRTFLDERRLANFAAINPNAPAFFFLSKCLARQQVGWFFFDLTPSWKEAAAASINQSGACPELFLL